MNNIELYNQLKEEFFIVAGPCVIEDEETVFEIADEIKKIKEELGVEVVFKASFDKANRTSLTSFRGVGLNRGIEILSSVKKEYNLYITTDIHETTQVEKILNVVDIIQIPALLCRQTDLILSAAKSKKIINIKKGQFLSPYEMQFVVEKAKSLNEKIMITERGTSFGYNRLVVDMSGVIEMKKLNVPLIYDATHSVQLPGNNQGFSGGNTRYIEGLSMAATALGINGVFFETHIRPREALSDAECMMDIKELKKTIIKLKKIDSLVKGCI